MVQMISVRLTEAEIQDIDNTIAKDSVMREKRLTRSGIIKELLDAYVESTSEAYSAFVHTGRGVPGRAVPPF